MIKIIGLGDWIGDIQARRVATKFKAMIITEVSFARRTSRLKHQTESFISSKVIRPETERSALSQEILCLVYLYFFFYCCVCTCCVRVFKEWMPNTVNVNEAQEFSNLLRINKFDFFIRLRTENT